MGVCSGGTIVHSLGYRSNPQDAVLQATGSGSVKNMQAILQLAGSLDPGVMGHPPHRGAPMDALVIRAFFGVVRVVPYLFLLFLFLLS